MAKGHVRDQQLAQIIADELDLIVGSSDDPRLSDLSVTRVSPAAGASSFVVCLAPQEDAEDFNSIEEIKEIIERATKYLRAELADSLNLKRAPQLSIMLDPVYALAKWGK